MKNWIRITIGISFTIVIITVVSGIIFYNMLKKSLPDYQGILESYQIRDEIIISTDSMGIPYIVVNNDLDEAFALGYIHARDRLFTMDLYRRAGQGRLSEIFGSETLKLDELFRTIGIERNIKSNIAKYNPVTLNLLNAYSDGVNTFINNNKSKLPIEFDILGYTPESWNHLHSLIIIRMIAWELNLNWWADFVYAELVEKFGVTKASEIIPDLAINQLSNIPKNLKTIKKLSDNFIDSHLKYRTLFAIVGTQLGSNNWVVNGLRSISGKPIIANDTHLPYSIPSKWYITAIKNNSKKIVGFTLPGVPGIVIGKNDNIAWTVTNLMNDETDFYLEQIDSSKKYYLLDNKWTKLHLIKDTIKIKNSRPKIIEILSTHRGPIISDVHQMTYYYSEKEKIFPAISMRWLGSEFSDEMYSFYRINKAQNIKEFKEALSDFSLPGQNFIYADIYGNIAYLIGANIPIRSNSASVILSDGSKSANDWKGYIQSNFKVEIQNPSEGFLASANNNQFQNIKYYITHLWEPTSRFDRIVELLKNKQKHSIADFQKYQLDIKSKYAEIITPLIIDAFSDVKITDMNLQEAIVLLKNWDFDLDKNSQPAAIYQIFLNNLLKNIFYDEMGEDLYNKFLFVASVPYRSLLKLLNTQSDWFNDTNTGKSFDKKAIIRKSLTDALTYLENNYGKNIALWQWGRIHNVTFKNLLTNNFKPAENLLNIGPFEVGGDGTTIFNTEYSFAKKPKYLYTYFKNPYDNLLGPVMRLVYDFANPSEIYLILNTGQSANFLSKHYKDMSISWLEGEYITVNISDNSFISLDKKKFRIIKK